MNKHILTTIDHQLNPGKYTKEQLRQNASEAAAIYAEYAKADYAIGAGYVDYAAANAAYYVYAATNAAADYAADYWVDRYLKSSKESKQDYIDEINRGKE